MSDYIYAFVLTAVAAVMVEMLAPSEEGGRLGGSVRLVAGLCMLVMLLQPLKEGIALVRSLADGDVQISWDGSTPTDEQDYQDILQGELAALGRGEVVSWVSGILETSFGIPKENHTVTVEMAPVEGVELPAVAKVTILLHGASIFENPHQIEDYITDRLGCPCTVAIQ